MTLEINALETKSDVESMGSPSQDSIVLNRSDSYEPAIKPLK